MISSNQDLYNGLEKLSIQLERSGGKDQSAKLKDAMAISSVPGEILGEIRLELRKLSTTTLGKEAEFDKKIRDMLSYLDKIL
jgi:hypothetical protein